MSEQIHNLACRCYRDKRVWIMVSLVLFAGFASSVFIFELDIGSNIIYGFLIFWGIILGGLTIGMIEVIKHMKSFCSKIKTERNGLSLIAIGFVSAIVLIVSLVIADNIQENYNYWITDKAIPYKEILRLNSNLPERMLTEDTWRKEITTLVDTQIEADEILYQVETMDQWNCDE